MDAELEWNWMEHDRGYVDADYLAEAMRLFAPIKVKSYERMRLGQPGRALDIGCGPGLDTVELARWVGVDGLVEGVDSDPAMVQQARQRAIDQGVDSRVRHSQGDAANLEFDDDSFDAARGERVFMHLDDPAAALAEIRRVVRPHGRIVVAETDWASISCDCDDVDSERRVARFRAEHGLNNGYAGRALFGLFKRQGLRAIDIDIFPLQVTRFDIWRYLSRQDDVLEQAVDAGYLGAEAASAWQAELIERDAAGRFFGSVNVIMASAINDKRPRTRPGDG